MNAKVILLASSVISALIVGRLTRRVFAAPVRSEHRNPQRPAIRAGMLGLCMLIVAALPMTSCGPSQPPAPPKASFDTLLADAKEGTVSAIDQIAGRVREGKLSDADVAAATDEALAARPSDSLGLRVAWGDVVDAALASGKLDDARKKRCTAEAVSVTWQGVSERFKDAGGASLSPSITFMFQASVGPSSTVSFDADIDSAQMDGSALKVNPKETAEPVSRARNPAVLDTDIFVDLPSKVAGKTLVVHWRVKIKDARSGTVLADDWDHTESIVIPATGSGSFKGRSARAAGGSK